MTLKKLIFFLLITIFSTNPIFAEDNSKYYLTGVGTGLYFTSELFKEELAPKNPRFTNPNFIDKNIRTGLKWRNENLGKASFASDVLLFGVFLPAIFITPTVTENKYSEDAEILMRTFVLNGLLNQATKFTFARERPYSHYGTRPSKGVDDHLSFYSGHTSHSFAIATAAAYLLAAEFPKKEAHIWSTGLTAAATVGYLRIASDKHYFSDVLIGGAVGVAMGYWVVHTKNEDSEETGRILFCKSFAF